MGEVTRKFTRRAFIGLSAAVASAYFFWKNFFLSNGREPNANGDPPVLADTKIVKAAIFPGIGIARIGNSLETGNDFFIGPEVTDPPPATAEMIRDNKGTGALKRQAARFRVYGLNAKNEVVGELTASMGAEITWQVHLANKKAEWFRFLVAMDADGAVPCIRRNSRITGAARKELVIDSQPRRISGRNSVPVKCDTGKFQGLPVYLGELRTDDEGRLLVLGGLGKSESPENMAIYEGGDTFNNANGWYDDISDGPVRASVRLNGKKIPIADGGSAWVAVTPPNYAPDIVGWRTLYELIYDTHIRAGMCAKPAVTSFNKDIWPLLERLNRHEWINQGFAEQFGHAGKTNFRESIMGMSPASVNAAAGMRDNIKKLYDSFRVPEQAVMAKLDATKWPMLYGDAYGSGNLSKSIHINFVVPPLQKTHLDNWVNGKFKNDWVPNQQPLRELAQYKIHEQPAMLDKAALHFCLADAFHPGCELTWPMRHATMYREPLMVNGVPSFRIRERPRSQPEPDYGPVLTTANAFTSTGPLNAQGAGDLTKWMALPWQGDTLFCRSGYEYEFHPFLPAYWPARVPNQVLSEDQYETIMASKDLNVRTHAFKDRESWFRNMPRAPIEAMHAMVAGFASMGVLLRREGPKGDPNFPEVMYVESIPEVRKAAERSRSRSAPGGIPDGLESAAAPPVMKAALDPAMKAGWEDSRQRDDWRAVRFGGSRKREKR